MFVFVVEWGNEGMALREYVVYSVHVHEEVKG